VSHTRNRLGYVSWETYWFPPATVIKRSLKVGRGGTACPGPRSRISVRDSPARGGRASEMTMETTTSTGRISNPKISPQSHRPCPIRQRSPLLVMDNRSALSVTLKIPSHPSPRESGCHSFFCSFPFPSSLHMLRH